MNTRPIIFSTPMIKAILLGQKTQTRRIVKQPYQHFPLVTKHYTTNEFDFHHDQGIGLFTRCPYGDPGDYLWVRETWQPGPFPQQPFNYKASCPFPEKTQWKPSIHMPKKACRILLALRGIKIERLQDIPEEDAKREGVYYYGSDDPTQDDYKNYLYDDKGNCDPWGVQTAKESFSTLWESIHGKNSWGINPWVWVLEFQPIIPKPLKSQAL